MPAQKHDFRVLLLLLLGSIVLLLSKPILSNVSNVSSGIVFEESFEGFGVLSHPLIIDKSCATGHARTYVSAPAFDGSKSARIELQDSDPEIAGGTRCEIAFSPVLNRENWYAFAMYFPKQDWAPDSYPEIISQWHSFPDEDLGESWRSPATKLLVVNDRLRLDIGYNTSPVNTAYQEEKKYDLGPLPKNRWQHFVFHIIHSHDTDGLVEVWLNGKKLLTHTGGNSFNDATLPFWKLGIYKWQWNGDGKSDVNKRVLYLDAIKLGSRNASIYTMSDYKTNTF